MITYLDKFENSGGSSKSLILLPASGSDLAWTQEDSYGTRREWVSANSIKLFYGNIGEGNDFFFASYPIFNQELRSFFFINKL